MATQHNKNSFDKQVQTTPESDMEQESATGAQKPREIGLGFSWLILVKCQETDWNSKGESLYSSCLLPLPLDKDQQHQKAKIHISYSKLRSF